MKKSILIVLSLSISTLMFGCASDSAQGAADSSSESSTTSTTEASVEPVIEEPDGIILTSEDGTFSITLPDEDWVDISEFANEISVAHSHDYVELYIESYSGSDFEEEMSEALGMFGMEDLVEPGASLDSFDLSPLTEAFQMFAEILGEEYITFTDLGTGNIPNMKEDIAFELKIEDEIMLMAFAKSDTSLYCVMVAADEAGYETHSSTLDTVIASLSEQ